MRWTDILEQSLHNLFRRRLRTLLTMLGVVIGTAAIIVTLSLGAGAEKAQMDALESTTNLKLIEVSPYYGSSLAGDQSRRVTRITDSVISDIRAMQGVDAVTPMVTVMLGAQAVVKTGDYENSTTLLAVLPADFAKIQPLKSGEYFTGRTDRMEFIMSEVALMDFVKPDEEHEWIDAYSILQAGGQLPLPPISWYSSRYSMALRWEDWDNYMQNNYEPEIREMGFKAQLTGIIEADPNDWRFSYYAIVNLSWLKKIYRENRDFFKSQGFELNGYDTVYVLANSVDNVENVIKQLNDYGLQYSSPMETVALMKKQIAMMQGFLGFIGAISMLVAALSIANTMMMSIYERTREIGVMKVLGCTLGNIRALFLTEAAYIGLFGGGAGLLLSLLLSYALNNIEALQNVVSSVLSGAEMFAEGGSTSIISPQLAWGTWLFVVAVSVISGLYPARRAMKLSSLAAIRSAE